jgi:hypothetical protein
MPPFLQTGSCKRLCVRHIAIHSGRDQRAVAFVANVQRGGVSKKSPKGNEVPVLAAVLGNPGRTVIGTLARVSPTVIVEAVPRYTERLSTNEFG